MPRASRSTIDKLREIVAHHQHAKVNGVRVDAFSAGTVLQVYDRLSDENKAKLAAMPIRQMVFVALEVAYKSGKR